MRGTSDDTTVHDHTKWHTCQTHWTTIVLAEQDDGTWVATKDGADVECQGTTAGDAATAYCSQISEARNE